MTLLKPRPQHTSLGEQLDDLLVSRFLPARWAARIWLAGELPARLQQCTRHLKPNAQWRAYGDGERIFFAIAQLRPLKFPNAPAASMDVYFLDGNATVYSAGVWEYDAKQGWWLDSVLEPSYDCDRGWWLDSVMEDTAARHLQRTPPLPTYLPRPTLVHR